MGYHGLPNACTLLSLLCTWHSNYIVKAEPLYQHCAQSCKQTEEALKELHIQHILHEMFQQMRIYGESYVLARSWQLWQR
jgi:hypothetical protein